MARLNKVIELIEQGKPAFGPFVPAGSIPEAIWIASSKFDFVVFEMEHSAFSLSDLRLSLQFMLDRKQIVQSGTLAPTVVPFVRIPINGREQNQWIVKQVLDIGVYGIVFPMINTPEDAISAIQACRYIQAKGAADQAPVGRRGHAPANALRYWGLSQPEYFDKADVWPLDPQGEILPCLQCETIESVENLPRILDAVSNKPGLILISESDLSVSLGCKGAYTKEVEEAVARAARTCKDRGVPFGSPQSSTGIEQRIKDGFLFLMPRAGRDTSDLDAARRAAGRS